MKAIATPEVHFTKSNFNHHIAFLAIAVNPE